jgi:hypothetical protein
MENKSTNSNIENLNKQNPFTVPDGYFEQFSSKLMSRIDEAENPPRRSVVWMRYLRPAVGLAASFPLIALLMYVPAKIIAPQFGNKTEQSLLDADDLDYYSITNDISFFELISGKPDKEPLTDATIETALLVSLNDFELYGYH